jgi:integrase
MATISFHFRPSRKPGFQEGSLFIRVIHDRKMKEITTNYRIFPQEWDFEQHRILMPDTYTNRVQHLIETKDKMHEDMRRLHSAVSILEGRGPFTIEDIVSGFNVRPKDSMASMYVETLCMNLIENGQQRTARAYITAVKRLIEFNNSEDVCLEDINPFMLGNYETHLKDNGKSMNTISFYMRNLRSIYNRAVKERVILPKYGNPFACVYTGVFPTRKRALTKEEMHRLAELEMSLYDKNKKFSFRWNSPNYTGKCIDKDLQSALAMFMFCFHARGMSFIDMAYLKKRNIKGDEISYCRRKTRKNLRIKITRPMKYILNYFESRTENSPYVFPIIIPGEGEERKQYEQALQEQNRLLKYIGRLAGINKNVSTHVARHSWATIARMEHIPLSVISEALGHRDERTTTIYLDSFNTSVIDRVSEQISRIVH